jgi:hypothetical protein
MLCCKIRSLCYSDHVMLICKIGSFCCLNHILPLVDYVGESCTVTASFWKINYQQSHPFWRIEYHNHIVLKDQFIIAFLSTIRIPIKCWCERVSTSLLAMLFAVRVQPSHPTCSGQNHFSQDEFKGISISSYQVVQSFSLFLTCHKQELFLQGFLILCYELSWHRSAIYTV